MPEDVWAPLEAALPALREAIDGAHSIVCIAHMNADPDTLGSAVAMARALRAAGKDAHVAVPDPVPQTLSWMPGFNEINLNLPGRPDLVIAVDNGAVARFNNFQHYVRSTAWPVINLDHHESNERFGTLNVVLPQIIATGLLVHRLLTRLGLPIDEKAATALYAAIYADSGGFGFPGTDAATLAAASDLISRGADPVAVTTALNAMSRAQLGILAEAASRLQSSPDSRVVWTSVTQAMLQRTGARLDEAHGVVQWLARVKGAVVALCFEELDAGSTQVHVRTREGVSAIDLTAPLGGGGHARAAGARVAQPIAMVRRRVVADAMRRARSAQPPEAQLA